VAGAPDEDGRAAAGASNAALLVRLFAAFNRWDAEALAQLIDPEFEFVPYTAMLLEGEMFRGAAGLREYDAMRTATWGESLSAELSEVRHAGERAVALGTLRARGRQSGVDVEMPIVYICSFRAGRVLRVEGRAVHGPGDIADALAQAGLPPDAFER
jgi:ketosteroid isomerase-like protein